MYASNAQDAIRRLLIRVIMISFLLTNCNLQTGRSRAPESVADDAAYSAGIDHSYYFIASFIEDHLRFHARIY